MNATQNAAWQVFRDDVTMFLVNKKYPYYTSIVKKMLDALINFCYNMILQINFLKSDLDYFPENLASLSEKQEERLHQDVKEIKRRCQ